MVAVAAALAVCLVSQRRRAMESYESPPRMFPELVGMRAVVAKSPSKDLTVVSFVVDAQGKLVAPPVVPWAGRPVRSVLPRFQNMFGARHVATSAQDVAHADKVVLVHSATTQRVLKVRIPKRWRIPPERLAVPAGTPVLVNPAKSARTKGVVLIMDANNTIKSAEFRA